MGKSKTPSFVVTRRIYTKPHQADKINAKMDLGNRIYNNGVKYCIPLVKELREDVWFQKMLAAWKDCTDKEEQKPLSEELDLCIQAYGLTEYAIHAYLGKGKQMAYNKGLGINIVQKLGTELYQSVRKAIFAGTQIHFRKYGQTNSLEDKKANSGIIYKPETDTVSFAGMSLKLKPIRKKDHYLMEAMTHNVKYCRIVRNPYKSKYHYFLQIVMEGTAPKKLVLGQGDGGLDPGVSTMSVVTEGNTEFLTLADGVERYEKDIRAASVVYERRRRMANPENYNPDGTIRRDTKTFHKKWRRTKGSVEALMRLKYAYQKKSAHIRNCHGYQTNRIVESCDHLIKEPMDYKALAKRAKKTSRQDKASAVKKKDGTVRMVYKFKRKKRFGSSIGRRAPAMFIDRIKSKMIRYGGTVTDVDIAAYKASQYDHTTGTCKKPGLGDRTKMIGGHRVQRDLYSAFLLMNHKDNTAPDQARCEKTFHRFLENQEAAIFEAMISGDPTGNFGLKDFIPRTPA